MTVRQYAYFALFSTSVSAEEMTRRLGVLPDEVSVRGGRSTGPPVVPHDHSWSLVCREPGLGVDELITRLLARLRPHTGRIADLARSLAADADGGAVLEVVRYFNVPDPDDHAAGAADPSRLLGWHLDRDVLDFLTAVGAELDVDEYDMAEPGEPQTCE